MHFYTHIVAIKNVTEEDSGTYEIAASNAEGYSTMPAVLTVKGTISAFHNFMYEIHQMKINFLSLIQSQEKMFQKKKVPHPLHKHLVMLL